MIYTHLALYLYIATMSGLHILCIISAVDLLKTIFICRYVHVAVTPYIFGCSSMFITISVANIS